MYSAPWAWAKNSPIRRLQFGLGRFNTEEEVDYVAPIKLSKQYSACAICRRFMKWLKKVLTENPSDGQDTDYGKLLNLRRNYRHTDRK
jgi:hypothetical protein